MQRKSRRTILRRIFKPAWLYFLLKKLTPLSHNFGSNRGEPIDRYYIEKFLLENSGFIKGVSLEVEDDIYTKKFGKENIVQSDILDIDFNNPKAAIRGDLRNLKKMPDNKYDCIILTQVLQFIDDYDSAIKECYRILKSGGVLLATLPFISRIDGRTGPAGDYWRFALASAKYIFEKHFSSSNIEIKSWGNVLSGLAFWVGMAQEELSQKELDYRAPDFPVIISIRATK
ncbi:MAG: methyltransferase domain-containing protein [Patescibacteria group bacterium]